MLRKATLAALAAILATSVGAPSWAAGEIGVTSAVLPNARGTPPNQATRILQVGNDMFTDERVQTVDKGKVHLLFLDGSAMSIGPNSDIVLDRFVYDPKAKTGELSFSATKGVFRFVGGRISKVSPVLIKTPNATIGVRGGVALISVGAIVRATLIYGDELFIKTGGKTYSVKTAGFRLQVEPDGSVGAPVATTSEDLGGPLSMLEGTESQTTKTRSLITRNDVAGSQISNLGSGLTPVQTGPTDTGQAMPAETTAGGDQLSDQTDIVASTAADRGEDNPNAGTGTGAGTGGLVGLYRHATVRTSGTDIDGFLDEPISGGVVASGQASGTTTLSSSSVLYPVSTTPALTPAPGSGSYLDYDTTATTNSVFGPIVPGSSFVSDTGEFSFVFADETGFAGHGVFAFLGAPTPSSAIPTTGFSVYSVRRDQFLNGDNPFIPEVDGGNFGLNSLDSGRAFINWTPNASGERAFAELTTFYSGLSTAQKSQTTVAVGRIIDDGNGKLHMLGEMRGSLRASTVSTDRTIYYSSAVSTLDAAGGDDFFGTTAPDYFVLASQSVNSADVVDTVDSGIDRITGGVETTPYDANLPTVRLAGTSPSDDPGRISGSTTLQLEYAGIVSEFFNAGGNNFARIMPLESSGPTFNLVSANGATGAISASASMLSFDSTGGSSLTTAQFGFGGSTTTSAFVANDEFGAYETSATVNGTSTLSNTELYFRSLDVRFTNLLSNVGLTPCTCDYLKIGLWGGYAQNASGDSYEFHQVPWVAGAPVTAADFPMSGTATYTGNAVAQVYNEVNGSPGQLYTAFGTFTASVTFAPNLVTLNDVDIAVDGAALNNMTGGANPNTQTYFPFGSTTGTRTGAGTLTTLGNARFTGTSGVLENMYGSYVSANAAGTYRQAGAFGAER